MGGRAICIIGRRWRRRGGFGLGDVIMGGEREIGMGGRGGDGMRMLEEERGGKVAGVGMEVRDGLGIGGEGVVFLGHHCGISLRCMSMTICTIP